MAGARYCLRVERRHILFKGTGAAYSLRIEDLEHLTKEELRNGTILCSL
jgi:predicted metalloprotease